MIYVACKYLYDFGTFKNLDWTYIKIMNFVSLIVTRENKYIYLFNKLYHMWTG
jgi:hypothetical protein